jgi:hypothetical protein
MASVFPVRGRPTCNWGYIKKNIVDKFNDSWTTVLCMDGKERKKAWEYGGFRIASSPKSCSIKAWTNCVNDVGDVRNQDYVKTPAI